jgi:hypothetical protein
MNLNWRDNMMSLWCVAALVLGATNAGCVYREHDHYDRVEVIDAHGYHHQGYYDEHHDWHGGYYDENHAYHDDAHDWHQ